MTVAHYNAVGVFARRQQAETAIEELTKAGFSLDRIGVAFRGGLTEVASGEPAPGDLGTKAGEGAAAGAAAGGAFGAAAGAVATGLIPGLGPLITASLLAGVAGGAAAGAAAGGLVGALVGQGLPEEEAGYYDREFSAGRAVVAVKAGDRPAEAAEVLRRGGAYRVSTSGPRTT